MRALVLYVINSLDSGLLLDLIFTHSTDSCHCVTAPDRLYLINTIDQLGRGEFRSAS